MKQPKSIKTYHICDNELTQDNVHVYDTPDGVEFMSEVIALAILFAKNTNVDEVNVETDVLNNILKVEIHDSKHSHTLHAEYTWE